MSPRADEGSVGGRAFNVEVAGWEDLAGNWRNVEEGGAPPSAVEAEQSTRIVVRWEDEDGEVHYRTTSHITDDFTISDWLGTNYGIEFA